MTRDHDFVQLLSAPVALVRAVDALPPAALASLLAALPGDRNSDPDGVRVQSLPRRTAQPYPQLLRQSGLDGRRVEPYRSPSERGATAPWWAALDDRQVADVRICR
jgi:hypothetical protein